MLIIRFLLKDRTWLLLLAVTLLILLCAATRWMIDHPYAISSDEALYFNDVLGDQEAIRHSGLWGLCSQIHWADAGRPPAFRLLALPFYLVLGFSPLKLRLVSLAFHWLGLAFLYFTVRKIASSKCAVLSVLICALSPDVLFSSVVFYTEYPLFLATTGTFYFLISGLESRAVASINWIGLGLSFGLGLLSKASFLFVGVPALAFVLVAGRIRGLSGPPPAFAIKAVALGSLVAAPWWCINGGLAWHVANLGRNYTYDSLGPPSFRTWIFWVLSVAQSLLGHGVTMVVTLILFAWIWKRFIQRQVILESVQRTVFLACTAQYCRSCWPSSRARTTSSVIYARLSYPWQSQSGCSPILKGGVPRRPCLGSLAWRCSLNYS